MPSAHESPEGRRIVVCEDDAGLRMVIETILSLHGYRVFAAARPAEALEIADAQAGAIDVLVTDFQLPQMNGHDLIRALKGRVPRLEALVLSGHPVDGLPGPPLPNDCAFLRKPFSDTALLETIARLLERAKPTDAGSVEGD